MSRIENTSDRDPRLHMLGALEHRTDPSQYIYDMESAGQAQLVHSDRVPADMGDEKEYLALGFSFGAVDVDDPMFRPATLPAGWSREGSAHAMWSYILDDKGRRRASIFYKAAFYDRSAHMGLVSPTAALSDLEYGDEDPTSLPIDDLLTVAVAREWLTKQRDHRADYFAKYASDTDRVQLDRLNLMIGLLPAEETP